MNKYLVRIRRVSGAEDKIVTAARFFNDNGLLVFVGADGNAVYWTSIHSLIDCSVVS